MDKEKRFAILIDADNISTKYIKSVLDEISNYGVATYKRAYGDLTRKENKNWEKVLLEHSITPMQQYSYTFGKNSSDSAMIIDAMDILYSNNVEGFCLVSSDSDFTRLATRLRESGMTVIGMGEQKAAKPFVKACTLFKYLDLISKNDTEVVAKVNKNTKKAHPMAQEIKSSEEKNEMVPKQDIYKEIIKIINEDEDNEFNIGQLGQRLNKAYPDFDVRNYGYSRLSVFLKSFEGLETKESYVHIVQDSSNKIVPIDELEAEIVKIMKKHKTKEGMHINTLKHAIEEVYPNFDIGNYGYSKFSTFLKDFDSLEARLSGISNSVMTIYLSSKCKESK